MNLVVQGTTSVPRTFTEHHQCMTPRARSARGVINPPLGPGPWALSPMP